MDASNNSTKVMHEGGVTWIDIENPTRQDINHLADTYSFHPLHLEDSLLVSSLPQLEQEDDYLFLLLHIPKMKADGSKVTDGQVAMFLGKDYLITLHTTGSSARTLFEECETDEAKRVAHVSKSSGHLLYSVLKALLEDTTSLVKQVLQELDATEDQVFDIQTSDASVIARLRQKILRLQRSIEPLETLTAPLPTIVHEITGKSLSHYYRNITRTAKWLAVIIAEGGETIEIYKDADFTASTERTNEILAVLTILFTLAIPATTLGTFYGMNILLPGGIEMGAWTFLGPFTTLILICIASLIPAAGMYWYFKHKHWF